MILIITCHYEDTTYILDIFRDNKMLGDSIQITENGDTDTLLIKGSTIPAIRLFCEKYDLKYVLN